MRGAGEGKGVIEWVGGIGCGGCGRRGRKLEDWASDVGNVTAFLHQGAYRLTAS